MTLRKFIICEFLRKNASVSRAEEMSRLGLYYTFVFCARRCLNNDEMSVCMKTDSRIMPRVYEESSFVREQKTLAATLRCMSSLLSPTR
jgi:hypothetical protein